jgi:long-subunit fatty acid transport protein
MTRTLVALAVSAPLVAHANPEPPLIADARSIGMGGTATASIDGASGALYNPASLGATSQLDVSATVSPFYDTANMPFVDPDTGEVVDESTHIPGALASLAVAYRVHPRVAAGLAVNLTSANGGEYEDVAMFGGEDASAKLMTLEALVPVCVRLHDRLDLAAGWRATYFRGSLKIPQPIDPSDPTAGFFTPELSGSGVNWLGASLGLRYRAGAGVTLGASYRTRVKQTIEATPKIDGDDIPGAPAQKVKLATPHDVRLGALWAASDRRLLLAADARYWFYRDSHPADAALGRLEDSKNAWGLNAGAEYRITPTIPVRAGALYWTSSTVDANASAFDVPPGAIVGATLGSGYRLADVDLDAAFGYLRFVDTDAASAQIPGAYDYQSLTFALSATYRK